LLRPPLERAGVDIESTLVRLTTYTRLVLEWNRGVSNIISRNDEARFVERHLVESIAPASWLKESGARHWLDFGSGAGLPAIPLAIAGIGERWTLVESRRTKTLFIRKTLESLSLTGFEVIHDRLENAILRPPVASGQDGFCSRATMPLGPTLALAAPVVRPGGVAFLWKGSGYEREMAGDPTWRSSWEPAGLEQVGSGPNVVAKFIRK
jgi:16S rRNA (guanine527-N7)-methyltransferase